MTHRLAPWFSALAVSGFGLFSFTEGAFGAQPDHAEEVWIVHADWRAFANHPEQWQWVRRHVDGFVFYVDQLTKADPEELKPLVRLLEENDIGIAIELGGVLTRDPLDETVGEWTAKLELDKIRPLIEAGGKIAYYNVDGAIRRTMNDPQYRKPPIEPFTSLDTAVGQLISSLKTTRRELPDVEFFLVTNFPNWGYKDYPAYTGLHQRPEGWGDYYDVIQKAIAKTREAGVPIAGVTVDNPYDYLIGETPIHHQHFEDARTIDWLARVRDLEDYVRSEGLEFNLMVNSQRGGFQSNQRFYEETLEFIDVYRAAGGAPKRWFVQTWYKHPTEVVPEDEPYTMTNLAKDAIRKIKNIP